MISIILVWESDNKMLSKKDLVVLPEEVKYGLIYEVITGSESYGVSNENSSDIDVICEKYYIKNYTINEDGTIDVNGNVGSIGGVEYKIKGAVKEKAASRKRKDAAFFVV